MTRQSGTCETGSVVKSSEGGLEVGAVDTGGRGPEDNCKRDGEGGHKVIEGGGKSGSSAFPTGGDSAESNGKGDGRKCEAVTGAAGASRSMYAV